MQEPGCGKGLASDALLIDQLGGTNMRTEDNRSYKGGCGGLEDFRTFT